MPIPAKPWKSIGMDFSGPYPEVRGYDYILVVICQMTNMVHLIPTRMDAMARDIAELYIKEVVRLHGLPESIVSDRDAKFTSIFWTELSKMLGQWLGSKPRVPHKSAATRLPSSALQDGLRDPRQLCPHLYVPHGHLEAHSI
jgi:hypothetical protein